MTVKEIIELQKTDGKLYLLRQGLFYRGYNEAAAFLHQALGYQVMAKEVKSCGKRLFYVGFPAGVVEKVREIVRLQGGAMTEYDNNTLVITGVTTAYDETALSSMVKPPRKYPAKKTSVQVIEASLAGEIAAFDLRGSTPLECMNFIARVQDRLVAAVS